MNQTLNEQFPGVAFTGDCRVYDCVKIGRGSVIEGPVILGKPPRGKCEGELELIIGESAVIRPFTTLYAGSVFGDRFQTGQGVSIRENNRIGNDVSIGTNSVLEFDNVIGDRSRVHSGCFLEMTAIGSDVFVGPNVVFTDDPHPMGCAHYKECKGGVTVEDLARIGANCTLLPGVVVGRNSLVGAGSVVIRNVDPDSVFAGNPAVFVKKISDLTCPPGFYQRPYEWAPYQRRSDETEK